MNRRHFFGVLVSALGFLSFQSALAERKRGGGGGDKAKDAGGIKLLDPKAPNAKVLNYVEKHADIKDAKLKTERQGLAFDKQDCANCGFYSKPQKHNGADVGQCQIFPGFHVKARAWCSSWNKKA